MADGWTLEAQVFTSGIDGRLFMAVPQQAEWRAQVQSLARPVPTLGSSGTMDDGT